MNTLSEHPAPQDSLITLREMVYVVMLRRWFVLGVFATVVGIAAFVVMYLVTPSYESTTTLAINVANVAMPVTDSAPPSDFEKLTSFQTQKDLITSSAIVAPVVDRLHLAQTRVLSRLEKMHLWLHRLRQALGLRLNIESWKKPVDPRASAIAVVMKNLDIVTKPESQALKIVYRAHDAHEAALTLQELVNQYSEFFYSKFQGRASGMVSYLDSRVQDAAAKLAESETAITEFRKRDRFVLGDAIGTEASSGLVGLTDSTEIQQEMKKYVLSMEEQLRQRLLSYPSNDPGVLALQRKIGLYIDALNALPEKEATLFRLKRELDSDQEAFLTLKRTLNRARLFAEGGTDKIRIIDVIDSATEDDEMVSPKRWLAVVLAVIFGFLFALMTAFVLDYIDPAVRSVRDAEHSTGVRVLASLPTV